MVNFKKVLATTLAATMVISASFTAFAADNEGSQDGAGSSEGHVDKEIVDVVLPTTTATTFAYTMDPERLITATDAAKYAEGTVFPAENDTGIYFLTGDKTYGNTSSKVQVINKGAVNQALTVTAKLTAGAKDIDILEEAPTDAYYEDDETKDKAGLYLAAKVAGVTQALSTTAAEWIIDLSGNANNYIVAYVPGEGDAEGSYVFKKKTSDLSAWKAADIEITGAVTEGIAIEDDTTAPTVTLTWAFADIDPDDEPEWTDDTELSDFTDEPDAYVSSLTISAASNVLDVTMPEGTTLSSVTLNKADGSNVALKASTQYTFANGKLTVITAVLSAHVDETITIAYSDEHTDVITIE